MHGEPYFRLRFRGLLQRTGAGILHLNQLHYYYRHRNRLVRLLMIARLALWLATARLMGMKVVWTLHNLYPHDSTTHLLDRAVRRLLFVAAGAVIVHCEVARDLFTREFGRHPNVHVVPHGNFIQAYPPLIDRVLARRKLGLPEDAFVYLYFGNLRSYKGIEGLATAFRAVADASARLVIAGKAWPGQQVALDQAIAGDPRITAILRPYKESFGGDDIRDLFSTADVAVLPYRQILTSGALMLALSYGRPVICPRLGCLPEYLEGCEGALLYQPNVPEALGQALRAARNLNLEDASAAARKRAELYDWAAIAAKTLAAYRSA